MQSVSYYPSPMISHLSLSLAGSLSLISISLSTLFYHGNQLPPWPPRALVVKPPSFSKHRSGWMQGGCLLRTPPRPLIRHPVSILQPTRPQRWRVEGWVSWGEPGKRRRWWRRSLRERERQEIERQTEKENKKTSGDRDRKR